MLEKLSEKMTIWGVAIGILVTAVVPSAIYLISVNEKLNTILSSQSELKSNQSELKSGFKELRTEMKGDFDAMKVELKKDLKDDINELHKTNSNQFQLVAKMLTELKTGKNK